MIKKLKPFAPFYVGVLVILVFQLLVLAPQQARADKPARRVAEVFNTAVPANTDVISTLTPGFTSVAYRVTVAIQTTDSVFNLKVTSGETSQNYDFNNGTALTAGRLYTFTFGASRSYKYNFQFETGCTVGYLLVEELDLQGY